METGAAASGGREPLVTRRSIFGDIIRGSITAAVLALGARLYQTIQNMEPDYVLIVSWVIYFAAIIIPVWLVNLFVSVAYWRALGYDVEPSEAKLFGRVAAIGALVLILFIQLRTDAFDEFSAAWTRAIFELFDF